MQVKENCQNFLKAVVLFFMDRVDPYVLRGGRGVAQSGQRIRFGYGGL